jgi:hypothetical protein
MKRYEAYKNRDVEKPVVDLSSEAKLERLLEFNYKKRVLKRKPIVNTAGPGASIELNEKTQSRSFTDLFLNSDESLPTIDFLAHWENEEHNQNNIISGPGSRRFVKAEDKKTEEVTSNTIVTGENNAKFIVVPRISNPPMYYTLPDH